MERRDFLAAIGFSSVAANSVFKAPAPPDAEVSIEDIEFEYVTGSMPISQFPALYNATLDIVRDEILSLREAIQELRGEVFG